MRRFLYVFLVFALLFSLAGCSFLEKEDAFDVEECLEEVEELIEDGEYEEAEKLLKRGIRKADDPEKLEACLMMVQAMLDSEGSGKTKSPFSEEAVEATRAPEASSEATEEPTAEATEATAEAISPTSDGPIRPSDLILLGKFSKEQHYQLNIFLSNFSEQRFEKYPCSDYAMINFGFRYAKINNREVFGSDGIYYYVEKANMDSILTRFFGRTVNVSGPVIAGPYNESFEYRNGAYYQMAADGESVAYCTAATNVLDQGDGTYLVYFTIYENVEPHGDMSSFYAMTDEQMASCGQLEAVDYGEAYVRDYTRSNGVKSYQLISYKVY